MSLDDLIASLGPGGRDFERLCKWLLESVPEYRVRLERVWLWRDWPGRVGRPDAGIDLVARERGAGLWAIQAKQYDPAYAIKKADIDSFLSESARAEFTYRLLIATTDHLGPTARRTLDHQEKPVGTILRSDLATIQIEWPGSIELLTPPRAKPKKPRPYQRHAVKEVVAGLADRDRGQLVMACGTGKTLVARFLHDELGAQRTLVLVPSLSLVKQTIREWFSVGDFDYLAVCSDDTVARDDRDAVVASTSELGVPVTTDPVEIAAFLRRHGSRPRVVFATYQSSQRIADAQTGRTPLDLVIADEAHRCAGPEAGVFATVLDPAKIRARKRLFMTATPRYYTGRLRREASEADWEIASMDDERKFGPELHRLTFAQAIEKDLLSDYRVVVVGVSDSLYRGFAQRGVFVTADGETITDARTLASQLGLLRAMTNHDLHRVVSFHSRIRSAREFATSLSDVRAWMPPRRRPSGKLWTQHVSGEMSSGEREARLNQLRDVGPDERGVLTNARCLTEGVDVPTLDGVAFIAPRRSQVDIVQAVGRAMRKADNKRIGTIVIPVFVDEEADPEEALESGEFDRVWQVVKALRAHDEVLADELDELRREQGRRKTSVGRPAKIHLDLPVGIGAAFARAFDTRVVERSTSSWQEGLGVAFAYRATHGDLRVPAKYMTEEGFRLGSWLDKCRQNRRRRTLSPERIAALDALGMIWNPIEEDWQYGIGQAQAFRTNHGNLRVPAQFVTSDGFALGSWVSVRRGERAQGKLSADRIEALDALDMVWNPFEEEWQRGIAAARAYHEANGRLRVPRAFVSGDGLRLGLWITSRRTDRARGKLSAERVAELDALGMVWGPHEEDWQRGIAAARVYLAANGHVRVPRKFITDDSFALGRWMSKRRGERARGALSAERMRELDALGMVWDPSQEDWLRGVAAAGAFREANGHLRVEATFVSGDGFNLGAWINNRRAERRRGVLAPEKVAELDALGMIWNPIAEDWREGVSAAREYREANGHLRVEATFVSGDGLKLGAWINSRRTERRRGVLAPEKVAELDALGLVWDRIDERWQRGVAAARVCWEANGHLRVPQQFITEDGFRLGTWISKRRAQNARGALSAERIRELDALGMVWDLSEEDWLRGVAAARAYREADGHLRVPRKFVAGDGFRLGAWLDGRRQRRRRRKLSPEAIAALDALGMIWNSIVEDWQRGIDAARAFHAEHGHLRVPRSFARDGFTLGVWLQTRRQERRRGDLAPERITDLDALDMVWDPFDYNWQRGIVAARAYHAEQGHLRVPQKHVSTDGFDLGRWHSARRQPQRQRPNSVGFRA